MELVTPSAILLYDGECGFCDRVVQFVLKRDTRERFRFAPLQSQFAMEAMTRHGEDPSNLSTMALILNSDGPDEKVLLRGKAALTTLSMLGGWGSFWGAFRFLPSWLLDFGYKIIARNRFRLGGRLAACRVPTPQERARFIGMPE